MPSLLRIPPNNSKERSFAQRMLWLLQNGGLLPPEGGTVNKIQKALVIAVNIGMLTLTTILGTQMLSDDELTIWFLFQLWIWVLVPLLLLWKKAKNSDESLTFPPSTSINPNSARNQKDKLALKSSNPTCRATFSLSRHSPFLSTVRISSSTLNPTPLAYSLSTQPF